MGIVDGPTSGGVVEKVLIREYTGDAANSRQIDLGDDYDLIEIVQVVNAAYNSSHMILARADRQIYSFFGVFGSTNRHYNGSNADQYFQGKMTGGDANKIKLGTSGSVNPGTNAPGLSFFIRAWKYSTILS